jgi:hypothetical protein
VDDVSQALNITRDAVNTACLSSNNVSNALVGVEVDGITNSSALQSGPIGSSSFGPVTTAGIQGLTIETWVSFPAPGANKFVLVEVARTGTYGDLPPQSETFQLRLAVEVDPTFITWDVQYLYFNMVPTQTTSSVVPNLFQGLAGNSSDVLFVCMTISQTNIVSFYAGIAGSPTLLNLTDSDSRNPISRFSFNSSSVLRFGATKTTDVFASMNGQMRLAAFYNSSLNSTQVRSLFDGGLPNSIPVVTPLEFVAVESQTEDIGLA